MMSWAIQTRAFGGTSEHPLCDHLVLQVFESFEYIRVIFRGVRVGSSIWSLHLDWNTIFSFFYMIWDLSCMAEDATGKLKEPDRCLQIA